MEGRLPIASRACKFLLAISLTPTSSFDVATKLAKDGEAPPRVAPPGVSLSAQPPRGSPAVNCRREPPPMGVGSGVFPRFPAAASSRDKELSTTTTAHTFWFQRRAQIVSTKTY